MDRREQKLQQACDDFNARYMVGTPVNLRRDNGDIVQTATRSPAEVLSGHSAVIWLDGVRGCYLLDRVTPILARLSPHHPARGE